MFRDNELLTGEDETMRQKDIEKFAFLYLCGQRDKDILAGKERPSRILTGLHILRIFWS